jgi:hypothetical protein
MRFNRFDIVDAYHLTGSHIDRVRALMCANNSKFYVSDGLTYTTLTDNGRRIYAKLCETPTAG